MYAQTQYIVDFGGLIRQRSQWLGSLYTDIAVILVDIQQRQHLLTRGCAQRQQPMLVYRKGLAIEDQFILPAHQIHINDGQLTLGGQGTHLIFPGALFVQVIRRRIQHQQQFCTLGLSGVRHSRPMPDILTNGHPIPQSGTGKHQRLRPRREVTRLIKYRIIRQTVFVINRLDPPPAQQTGTVVEALLLTLRMPYQHGQRRCCRETLQGSVADLQKVGTQEQVFWGITTEGQLRCHQQVGTCSLCRCSGGQQTISIARHIADPAVDLRQGDAHQRPSTSATRVPKSAGECTQ